MKHTLLPAPRPHALSSLMLAIGLVTAPAAWSQSPSASAFDNTPFLNCSGAVVTPAANDWRLTGTGDIVFADAVNANQEAFKSFMPVFQRASVVLGNLEGAITNETVTAKKYIPGRSYAFRFPPEVANLIKEANFNVISIANNHSNDYGRTGQQDTVRLLTEKGIQVTGLKGSHAVVNVGNLKVAVVAGAHYGAFNNVLELDAMAAKVSQLRQSHDAVVLFYQLGAEGDPAALLPEGPEVFLNEQRGDARAFAQRMQAAGASLMIGHGPHVVRAAECVGSMPVFHSIGNFVSAGGLSTRNLANVAVLPEVLFDDKGQVRGVRAFAVTYSAQRYPVLDATGRGVSLVNALGRREARVHKNFSPLPLASDAAAGSEQAQSMRNAFSTWLNTTSLKGVLSD